MTVSSRDCVTRPPFKSCSQKRICHFRRRWISAVRVNTPAPTHQPSPATTASTPSQRTGGGEGAPVDLPTGTARRTGPATGTDRPADITTGMSRPARPATETSRLAGSAASAEERGTPACLRALPAIIAAQHATSCTTSPWCVEVTGLARHPDRQEATTSDVKTSRRHVAHVVTSPETTRRHVIQVADATRLQHREHRT